MKIKDKIRRREQKALFKAEIIEWMKYGLLGAIMGLLFFLALFVPPTW